MDLAAFTALSGALTSLKTIIEISKTVNNQQLNAAVLEVQGKLIDVQQQCLSLQQENQDLRTELKSVRDISDIAAKLRYDGQVYWKEDDQTFPFCPVCWDRDKQLVRLQVSIEEGQTYHGKQILECRCLVHEQLFEVMR